MFDRKIQIEEILLEYLVFDWKVFENPIYDTQELHWKFPQALSDSLSYLNYWNYIVYCGIFISKCPQVSSLYSGWYLKKVFESCRISNHQKFNIFFCEWRILIIHIASNLYFNWIIQTFEWRKNHFGLLEMCFGWLFIIFEKWNLMSID
jgi:hypothetical protein